MFDLILLFVGGISAWIAFMEKDRLYVRLFLMLWVIISFYGLRNLVLPSYFKCMAAVRGHMTFDELKRLVEREVFIQIELPRENRYGVPKLYVSDEWFQLNGIFIPIEWIRYIEYDFFKSKTLGATEVFLMLKNGKIIEVGKFQSEYLDDILDTFSQKLPRKEIVNSIKT